VVPGAAAFPRMPVGPFEDAGGGPSENTSSSYRSPRRKASCASAIAEYSAIPPSLQLINAFAANSFRVECVARNFVVRFSDHGVRSGELSCLAETSAFADASAFCPSLEDPIKIIITMSYAAGSRSAMLM
jgi:hypothetical protein